VDACVNWCDFLKVWTNDASTMRVHTRVAHLLDPATQPDPWDLPTNSAPNSPDHRLGDGTFRGPPAYACLILCANPDLTGNVLPGISLVPQHPGNGWDDVDYHGTRMAALIAAHGHDGAGILGIDWADIDAKYRTLVPLAGVASDEIEKSLARIHDFRGVKQMSELVGLLEAGSRPR